MKSKSPASKFAIVLGTLSQKTEKARFKSLAFFLALHWDAEARATIVGLTRGANRHHLARAALESIAYQSRDLAEAMREDYGSAIAELRVDGGAVSKENLCDIFEM